jgi:Flp pilus assembly protein TadG
MPRARPDNSVKMEAGGRLRREDGQAAVEFAIALPLLLILVTGIIQFGSLYNKYLTLTDAARSGAQTLALGRGLSDGCDPAVLQTLQSASAIGLTSGQVTMSFPSGSDTCGTGTYPNRTGGNEVLGDQATVIAAQPFTVNVFGMSLGTLSLSASASDAIE